MKMLLILNDCEAQTLRQLSLNQPWRDARTRAAGLLNLFAGAHPSETGLRSSIGLQMAPCVEETQAHGPAQWARGWPTLIQTAMTVATEQALKLKGISQRVQEIEEIGKSKSTSTAHSPCNRGHIRSSDEESGYIFGHHFYKANLHHHPFFESQ